MKKDREEEIIFDNLSVQHARILLHIDALDQKIAQAIALNGVILSFVFDKLPNANSYFLFSAGLILILVSIVLGFLAYSGKVFMDSPNSNFYKDNKGIEKLKDQLLKDNDHNISIQKTKGKLFNLVLFFGVVGLILIIGGYYA